MKIWTIMTWNWIKEALITESEKAWNQGDLRKRVINYYGTGYLDMISFWYSSAFKSL